MNVQLFLIRGVIAIVWAVAFAVGWSGDLTTSTTILLVLYPVIDLVASIIDARGQHGRTRTWLAVNAAVSAATAIALGIAASISDAAALGVFGIWAGLTGAAQLVVAIRRRQSFGRQWPLLLAGAGSTVLGVVFIIMAFAADDPNLRMVTVYAAGGGIEFIIQAWLLARRGRSKMPSPTSQPAT